MCQATLLWSQEADGGLVVLQGRVVEAALGIPDVHILNLSASRATITDADGAFRIGVRRGDTLRISAVRYKRIQWRITEAMLKSGQLEIALEPFVNDLEEVVVSPYDLTGDLAKDLQKLPGRDRPTAISLGLPNARARRLSPTENRIHEATTGAGIVPLNPLLNAITGRTRRLKKQLAFERRYEKIQRWRLLYPDSVLTRQLNIPEARIEDFMYFCELDEAFEPIADSGNQLQIWGFLRRKSLEYRQNNRLD